MKRNVDINTISDGKRYKASDMAKLGCNDCSGCSACCQNMADTIILDPYDVYLLTKGLSCSFDTLISKYAVLRIVDGIILPKLKMEGENHSCHFLDENGRCQIHEYRPGICRLFPLGRIYENGSFSYFLQKDECLKTNRNKVKIQKWIGYPDFNKYEQFVCDWHYFIKDLSKELSEMDNMNQIQKIQYMMLQLFYARPYEADRDFYEQFYERLAAVKG